MIEEGAMMHDGVPSRSVYEAPDVDPLIYVAASDAPEVGCFAEVEITGSVGYDCLAEIVEGKHSEG
jgi:hypothetical protein